MKNILKIFILCNMLISAEVAMGKSKFWETPDKTKLKEKLTDIQYKVTQKDGTEPAYKNKYWDTKKEGIYVDIVSGEPLFSSTDKYDSKSGWPSFTKPIDKSLIIQKKDFKLFRSRIEVRSKHGNSHLGHVFPDGPKPTGDRYCINSAAMKFIPKEQLKEKGYSEYLKLFEKQSKANIKSAYLAGGCFWGVEELIRKLPGVTNTETGYSGGSKPNPIYDIVRTGSSGYAESVKVEYDPTRITYKQILKYFFRLHDPTTLNQQGNDKGTQYRSAIFYSNDEEKEIAAEVIKEVDKSKKWKKPVVTKLEKFNEFYMAEDYHQDYLQKNPNGYTCHFLRN